MSRYRPPAAVVRATMLATLLPVAALAWAAAVVVAPSLAPTAVATAAGGAASWGARVGVLASPGRRGFARRQALRVAWLGGVVGLAGIVELVSGAAPHALWDSAVAVSVALLVLAFLVGRSVGRIHRRQADPLTTRAAHVSADAALVTALLVGVVAVTGLMTVSSAAEFLTPLPWWTGLAWLVLAIAAIGGARPAVLHARTSTTALASDGWVRALSPLTLATAVVLGGVAVALTVGEHVLRDALSRLLALDPDLAGRDPSVTVPTIGAPPRWSVWLLALLLVTGLLVAALRPVDAGRRRRRPVVRGPGMPLLVFLRSLLAALLPRRPVDDEEVPLDDPQEASGAALRTLLPAWTRRLRPRPRDPTAAIMHDYRTVQRRLPRAARRRPAETVLAHARRHDAAELHELADLVCAVRYGGRVATPQDAERSRGLTRRLVRS